MTETEPPVSNSCNLIEALLGKLPKERFWDSFDIYQWEGFWLERQLLEAAIELQSHFNARDDDVILTSTVKTGTTWLKALCLCIMQQQSIDAEKEDDDILIRENPQTLVPTVESMQAYAKKPQPYLSDMPSPRLLHTHLPYTLLPDSIKNSECKVVYITRNPKDTLVSMWHFLNTICKPNQHPIPFEKAFECFCNGIYLHGPFFDHVLQFWKESLRRPQKILFLKYEELKKDPKGQVKRLASFLGKPFRKEEEVDKLLWRCSLERLKNLDVNMNGIVPWTGLPNSSFFRVGVIGDWKNYLTPDMEDHLNQITGKKLDGSGLDLEI